MHGKADQKCDLARIVRSVRQDEGRIVAGEDRLLTDKPKIVWLLNKHEHFWMVLPSAVMKLMDNWDPEWDAAAVSRLLEMKHSQLICCCQVSEVGWDGGGEGGGGGISI